LVPSTIYDSLILDEATCTGLKDQLKSLPFSDVFNFNAAFGIFGNPHVDLEDDWISSSNEIDFDAVTAVYADNYCQTMSSVQLMIYYSYVVSEEAKQFYILRISQQPMYKNVSICPLINIPINFYP
jgi:hypothetical protein